MTFGNLGGPPAGYGIWAKPWRMSRNEEVTKREMRRAFQVEGLECSPGVSTYRPYLERFWVLRSAIGQEICILRRKSLNTDLNMSQPCLKNHKKIPLSHRITFKSFSITCDTVHKGPQATFPVSFPVISPTHRFSTKVLLFHKGAPFFYFSLFLFLLLSLSEKLFLSS